MRKSETPSRMRSCPLVARPVKATELLLSSSQNGYLLACTSSNASSPSSPSLPSTRTEVGEVNEAEPDSSTGLCLKDFVVFDDCFLRNSIRNICRFDIPPRITCPISRSSPSLLHHRAASTAESSQSHTQIRGHWRQWWTGHLGSCSCLSCTCGRRSGSEHLVGSQ